MIRTLLLFWTALSAARAQGVLAITGAEVFDGSGAEPRAATVVVEGGRIAAVGPGVSVPEGARVIRAEGMTLLPGLFDVHTHLPYSAVGGVTGDWPKIMAAYLLCGVTSVADFGVYPEMFEPMRRLIAEGRVRGPRLHLAARFTTPGGHGAEGGRGDFFTQEVLTPREARAAMRRILPYKPDAIKVFTDGWRYGTDRDMTSMDIATLRVIVADAHSDGLPVLTHTVTLDKAKIAARAGVDVIAHGIGDAVADEELLRLMKENGVSYSPTLAVYEPGARRTPPPLELFEPLARAAVEKSRPSQSSPEFTQSRNRRWENLMANTAALRSAGVRFAAGTDAGVTGAYHGFSTLREVKLLVEGGLTPIEALAAATGNAARALRVAGERGFIAPGMAADLVLVEGAPHRNIADIDKKKRVFLNGEEMDRATLLAFIASPDPSPIPARQAGAQVDNFERDRTLLDTRRVNSTDSGLDNTRMLFGETLRAPGNRALLVTARMGEKDHPYAQINLPLSKGAVEPVDASAFRGVEFDARGEGEYWLSIPARAVRDGNHFRAPFRAEAHWRKIRIPFASLKQEQPRAAARWTARDLLMLSFGFRRPAAAFGWLELDNIHFYR